MKSKLFFTLALTFLFTSLLGQNEPITEANYRLAEQFSPTKVKRMVFSTSVRPNWMKTGDKFWYSYKTSNGTNYYIVDLNNQSKIKMFDNDRMAAMLTLITKDPYDGQHLPEIKPEFKKDDTVFQFDVKSSQEEEIEKKDTTQSDSTKSDANKKSKKKKTEKKVFHLEYNLKTGELYEIEDWEEEKKDPKWANISPNGEYVIFSRNYNLYWIDKDNYEKAKNEEEGEKDSTIVEHQLTFDGKQHYAYGGGYTAGENDDEKKIKKESEKRRRARIYWSQDSRKFALIRYDQRDVKTLWVIDVLANPRPELESYKYTMPGEENNTQEELRVFTMSDTSRKQYDVQAFNDQSLTRHREIKTNKEKIEDYVATTWLSKTSDKLYFTRRSRDLYKMDICELNLATGEINIIIKERMNTYLEQKTLHMIGNGNEFIHWSERDGWAHLYLYDGNGNVKKQLTSGPWHVSNIEKVDAKNRVVYFTANGKENDENPYYTHLYRVNFDGTGLKVLNAGNYNHHAQMSDSYKYFINNFSRVNTTPKSEIRDNNGDVVLQLETADLSNLFAAGYKFPEIFKAKAADGITDIYGVIYKPFNFDSTKSYPLIQYVYPGPQTEGVNSSFSARMDRTDRFAQLGFIVVTLGNRGGHPDRSKWYHTYSYGNLRDYGLADKVAGIQQLADRHPFIDRERVGIYGHSGGGFMSTAALLNYPEIYDVAVSSAGNHDNQIYNRWWSEKHHGVERVEDDEGNVEWEYDIDSNIELAPYLKGKLLLTTGDVDNNVHPAATIRMAEALIEANKRFDFFLYPGQRHGYGSMNNYWFWQRAEYFAEHLLGDARGAADVDELNARSERR